MRWIILVLSTSALLLQQSCCNEDHPAPLTELEKLPAPTRTGKQTFGCLLNGVAFVTNSTSDAYAVFQRGILSLAGEDSPHQWVGIILSENGTNILEAGTYDLTSLPYQEAKAYYGDCYYYEEHTLDGTITITMFDKVNWIVSGTFNFTTVAPGCDTLKVTNGRFDIKYIP